MTLREPANVPASLARMWSPMSLAHAGRYRIAYLDDDEDYAYLFKYVLERQGHEVLLFLDPKAALDALDGMAGTIDAFISDYHMPGRNGIAVVLEARRRQPGRRYAVISSDVDGMGAAAVAPDMLVTRKPEALHEFPALLARVLLDG
jgi:CheY-like chemotaxis protein